MSVRIGSMSVTAAYVGSTAVTKIYIGTTQIYPIAAHPILVSDSFTAADVATINGVAPNYYAGGSVAGLTWVSSANIGIIAGKLGPAASASAKVARLNVGVKNGYVEALYDTLHGSSVGCVGRYVDASNYYRVSVGTTGVLLIEKNVAGTISTLYTSAAGVGVVGARIGLGVNGTNVSAYVNGSLVQTVADTGVPESANGIYWGVTLFSGSTTGRLDNVRIATGQL